MNKSVIVVGAGVVGLACGKELSEKGYEVFIAEQEKNIATQTSARNSGVIHAGIYYPTDSLKANFAFAVKIYCTNIVKNLVFPIQILRK